MATRLTTYTLFSLILLFPYCEMGLKSPEKTIKVIPHPKGYTLQASNRYPSTERPRFAGPHLADVSLTCSAFDLVLRVKPSFYGIGADESELQLGPNCRSNGVLSPSGDLLFAYPLTACGSRKELTSEFLVYKYTLYYEPSTEKFPSRASRVDVEIECRYRRYHDVHQLAVKPTWRTTYLRKKLKVHSNEFQIHLMDDSWSNPVENLVFHLGQEVHVQISAPRLPIGSRLYVDNCFALPQNGSSTSRKYTIIGNLGCMLDSKRDPGGSSGFLQGANKTLRFSFKAFQFILDSDRQVGIYCKLFASSEEPSPVRKSCTYGDNRWTALLGHDAICQCCDSRCGSARSKRRSLEGMELKNYVGSVKSAFLVADPPHDKLNQPQDNPKSPKNGGQRSEILKENMGHASEKKKYEEAVLKTFTKDESSKKVEEELRLHSKAVEVNQKTTKMESPDVQNQDPKELTWYFSWT
ncbi:zona pellucida sperm-binding protein 3-like [Stigmatopora nigra]